MFFWLWNTAKAGHISWVFCQPQIAAEIETDGPTSLLPCHLNLCDLHAVYPNKITRGILFPLLSCLQRWVEHPSLFKKYLPIVPEKMTQSAFCHISFVNPTSIPPPISSFPLSFSFPYFPPRVLPSPSQFTGQSNAFCLQDVRLLWVVMKNGAVDMIMKISSFLQAWAIQEYKFLIKAIQSICQSQDLARMFMRMKRWCMRRYWGRRDSTA